jgi:hypothetical protein
MSALLVVPLCAFSDLDGELLPCADWPPLPALCELLRRGARTPVAGDWQQQVLQHLQGGLSPYGHAAGAVASNALANIVAGSSVCLVAPVHLVAGMSRVHLPPWGVLDLADEQRVQFQLAFEQQFQSDGVRLHALGDGWVLEAGFAAQADEGGPAVCIGMPLQRAAAMTAAARALRRFGAEVELWLAELPLNRERERRGEPVINSLWCWGGGVKAVVPAHDSMAALYADVVADPWMLGAAASAGIAVQPAAEWRSLRGHGRRVVVLQGSAAQGMETLQALESAWFEPILAALRTRALPALRLSVGAWCGDVSGGRWRRWWQRSQPWWQQVRT